MGDKEYDEAFAKAETVFGTATIDSDQALNIEVIKQTSCRLWALVHTLSPKDGDGARCAAIAKTNLETAMMFAVKAISRAK